VDGLLAVRVAAARRCRTADGANRRSSTRLGLGVRNLRGSALDYGALGDGMLCDRTLRNRALLRGGYGLRDRCVLRHGALLRNRCVLRDAKRSSDGRDRRMTMIHR
jgi:hypothetical protein